MTLYHVEQWWFVNPGSDSAEISLIRTKSAGTDFLFWTDGQFRNPENSLIQKYRPGTNVSGLTNRHCIYLLTITNVRHGRKQGKCHKYRWSNSTSALNLCLRNYENYVSFPSYACYGITPNAANAHWHQNAHWTNTTYNVDFTIFLFDQSDSNSFVQKIVAAFRGMHVSPAKHSYASVTDG